METIRRYHVIPVSLEGFSPELVQDMHAYWMERPAHQRADGAYVLHDDAPDQPDPAKLERPAVTVRMAHVTFEIGAIGTLQTREVYRFFRWVEKQEPCHIIDDRGEAVDPDCWLAIQLGLVVSLPFGIGGKMFVGTPPRS